MTFYAKLLLTLVSNTSDLAFFPVLSRCMQNFYVRFHNQLTFIAELRMPFTGYIVFHERSYAHLSHEIEYSISSISQGFLALSATFYCFSCCLR